mgnify:CR=1 FL=1
MRKLLLICALAILLSSGLQAAIVERTYTFTGADLINNVFGSYRYSTDGSLKAYEGMRSLFPGLVFTYTGSGATYLGTSGTWATNFNNLWNAAIADNRVLSSFLISSGGGDSGQWGADYKALEYISGTGPQGWSFSAAEQQWTTTTAGLSLNSTELDSQIFTVTLKFDTEDMWWENPNNYLYGCNTAPNSLDGGLTMYFESFLSKDGVNINKYEGNFFAVPEPVTMCLLALGGLLFRKK